MPRPGRVPRAGLHHPVPRADLTAGLRLARDDHRRSGRLNDGGAHGTQQHSRESATAVAADHNQLGGLRVLDELTCWPVTHDLTVNLDIGIALLPPRKTLG